MIREAVAADIPTLVAWGREFHAMAPHNPMGTYDEAAVARMLRFMIDSPQAMVLTNGTGAIGGVYAPVYFNPAKWMLEESFWWSRKAGLNLLHSAIEKGRAWGASYLLLSTLENSKSPAIDRMLARQGFVLLERRYLKEL